MTNESTTAREPRITVTRDDLTTPGGLVALVAAAAETLGLHHPGSPTTARAASADAHDAAAALMTALHVRAGDEPAETWAEHYSRRWREQQAIPRNELV